MNGAILCEYLSPRRIEITSLGGSDDQLLIHFYLHREVPELTGVEIWLVIMVRVVPVRDGLAQDAPDFYAIGARAESTQRVYPLGDVPYIPV